MKRLILTLLLAGSLLHYCDGQTFSSTYSSTRECSNEIFSGGFYRFSIDNHMNLTHDVFYFNFNNFTWTAFSFLSYIDNSSSEPRRYTYNTYMPIGYHYTLIKSYPKFVPDIGIDLHLLTSDSRLADPEKILNLRQPWVDVKSSLLITPLTWLGIKVQSGYRTNFNGPSSLPIGGFYAGIAVQIGIHENETCKYYARVSKQKVRQALASSKSLVNTDTEILEDYLFLNLRGDDFNDVKNELTERYYHKVCEINDYKVYTDYLKDVPEESPFHSLVKEKVANIDWTKIKSDPNLSAIKEFLDNYPNSTFRDEATDYLNWYSINRDDSSSVKEFVTRYPESPFAQEAHELLIEFEFNDVKKINTPWAYKAFYTKYPDHQLAKAAMALSGIIELEEVKRKNTIEAYKEFIRLFSEIDSITLMAKEGIEDLIIDEIMKKGPGKRFRIAAILPEKEGLIFPPVSIAYEQIKGKSDLVTMKTLYPKDELLYVVTGNGLVPAKPTAHTSIIRFIGEIEYKGYTFIGEADEPLTFILLEEKGLTYLHGRGVVRKNGAVIKQLPEGH